MLCSSNGNLPSNVPQIVPCSFSPVDTRNEFDSVLKDKELIVHEQLSAIQRDRYQTCRQKFMTLNCMRGTGKLWDDLQTIRADVATETASMARRKLLMNYYWYHDLVMDLPPGIKHDRLFADVLHRLQELSKVCKTEVTSLYTVRYSTWLSAGVYRTRTLQAVENAPASSPGYTEVLGARVS
jgi:hypothetical protein